MPFTDGEWCQCTVDSFDNITSPLKGTPGFELVCSHPEYGTITGHWWLTDTLNNKGVPMWQVAKDRCIKLGCDEAGLNGPTWVEHARGHVVGKTVACMVEIDNYGEAKAKFIGIPKGSQGGGFVKSADGEPSLFAGKSASRGTAADDDDLPF